MATCGPMNIFISQQIGHDAAPDLESSSLALKWCIITTLREYFKPIMFGMMHESRTGELLAKAAFVHHDVKEHGTI